MGKRKEQTDVAGNDVAEVNEQKAAEDSFVDRVADNPAESAAINAELQEDAVNEDQAALSDGSTLTAAEVEAANKGRLARGEEPVVPGNVESARLPEYPDVRDLLLDGLGEDTISAKQSSGRRLVDGSKIVEFNAATGEESVVAEVEAKNPKAIEAAQALAEAQTEYEEAVRSAARE